MLVRTVVAFKFSVIRPVSYQTILTRLMRLKDAGKRHMKDEMKRAIETVQNGKAFTRPTTPALGDGGER